YLASLEGDQHGVVLIAARTGGGALGGQHAHHRKRHIADTDDLTNRRLSVWKEIGGDRVAEDRHVVGVGVVLGREGGALGYGPAFDREIGRRDCLDPRGPVLGTGDNLRVAGDNRADSGQAL